METVQFEIDEFVKAYLECALFADLDEGITADLSDIADETIKRAVADCYAFRFNAAPWLAKACERDGYDMARAGHDFWLTRNGHGAGFWDRAELKGYSVGRLLSRKAERFESLSVYAGDDGKVYFE